MYHELSFRRAVRSLIFLATAVFGAHALRETFFKRPKRIVEVQDNDTKNIYIYTIIMLGENLEARPVRECR